MKTATLFLYDNGTAALMVDGERIAAFCGPASWVRTMAVLHGIRIAREAKAQ